MPNKPSTITVETLEGVAEALCNLWGDDPNDQKAWNEAYAYAPTYIETHRKDFF